MLHTRRWALIWTVLRLAMAATILAAVIAQLAATTGTAVEMGRDLPTTIANFFSFFTILSNIGAGLVLLWAGVWLLAQVGPSTSAGRLRSTEPRALTIALSAATTYMLITGAVYNILLRSVPLPIGGEPIPWSNEVLHLVGPLFLLIDLFVGPARRALRLRAVWAILAFPILWSVYTLVRGPLVTDPSGAPPYWYPYPFLNPNNFDDGYGTVALYIGGIAAAIIAVAFFVVWVGRRRVGGGTPAG